MNSKKFKEIFDKVAKANEFSKAFGGWIKESPECIVVLELQKSNFGDYYILNIKVFIRGVFGREYILNKDLVKSSMGHITNQIREKDFLNFDTSMDEVKRYEKLEEFFIDVITPFTNRVLSKAGIKELAEHDKIFLLPTIIKELGW